MTGIGSFYRLNVMLNSMKPEIIENNTVYMIFQNDFPIEQYSIVINTIFTNSNSHYNNHVVIASNDSTKQNGYVQKLNYKFEDNLIKLTVVVPKQVINHSIINGSEILVLPNKNNSGLSSIKGRLILQKMYAAPSHLATNFDRNGYLRFLNDTSY